MRTPTFGVSYASVYDSLYRDKDYERECDFLEESFRRHGREVRTVLDLGCGTGGHAIPLSRRGYRVVGVDRSPDMLEIARRKAASGGHDIEFVESDLASLDLGKRFDAAIAMFAVLSYQTDDDALLAALRAARRHLDRSGLFVFDAWHGPGVLADPPTPRMRVVEDGELRVIRLAEPELDIPTNTVLVNFTTIAIRGQTVIGEFRESHPMRYFFPREIVRCLHETGFVDPSLCAFPQFEHRPDERTWQFAVMAQADGP